MPLYCDTPIKPDVPYQRLIIFAVVNLALAAGAKANFGPQTILSYLLQVLPLCFAGKREHAVSDDLIGFFHCTSCGWLNQADAPQLFYTLT
jgi:hypothetical protein